jgi:hypothetical protein
MKTKLLKKVIKGGNNFFFKISQCLHGDLHYVTSNHAVSKRSNLNEEVFCDQSLDLK